MTIIKLLINYLRLHKNLVGYLQIKNKNPIKSVIEINTKIICLNSLFQNFTINFINLFTFLIYR